MRLFKRFRVRGVTSRLAAVLALLMLAPPLLGDGSAFAEQGVVDASPMPAAAPAPTLSELRNPDWIAEGRKKFVQTCAFCHGVEGQAGKTRSFKTREAWDPQIIHDTIAEGRVNGPNVMPSWKGSIPDELIWKLVAYVKSLNADAQAAADK